MVCAGGALSIADKNRWWDHVDVSSNSSTKDKLLDGDAGTFWESSGRSGAHKIEVFMKKGVIVRYVVNPCFVWGYSQVTGVIVRYIVNPHGVK